MAAMATSSSSPFSTALPPSRLSRSSSLLLSPFLLRSELYCRRRCRRLSSLAFCLVPSRSPRVSTAPVEQALAPCLDFIEEISRLDSLRSRLRAARSLSDKHRVLDSDDRVKGFFKSLGRSRWFSRVLSSLEPWEVLLIKCLVAAGQGHVLGVEFDYEEVRTDGSALKSSLYALADMVEKWSLDGNVTVDDRDVDVELLKRLLNNLDEIERFYDCIGGIIGYQIMALEFLFSSKTTKPGISWSPQSNKSLKSQFVEIHVPKGLNLVENAEFASQAALWGIEGLPELGEIYPLGGAGDRLGLADPYTGECLPAAMLPYCGRTLLEGLIRDLQAREFLHFKIFGKQCITPVAIMTSSVKNNHDHITALCERLGWFGRGRQNFNLFEQPLVPVVTAEDGQWLISRPFSPVGKPGGHGAIWKLAHDKGIFQWFYRHGRKGATVRQVSNVVAATDLTLLALAGIGLHNKKKLGFASCQRSFGATEGINVLLERQNSDGDWEYGLTCIEYTEFEKFGIRDAPISLGSLQAGFPGNTNVLYVDLHSAEEVGSSQNASSLPGMVLNMKKPVYYLDHFGVQHSVSGGRLECTMQNIADSFLNIFATRCSKSIESALDSFIIYNERKKVTSSAKRKRKQTDTSLHQTPDGSLLDILRNVADILSHCNITLPKVEDNIKYLQSGPPFLILLHPALGPLWEVTRQKFFGGSIMEGSELQIEVAEFMWREVQLDGSLLVIAENIMGSTQAIENGEPLMQYGHRCARCKLQNVKVQNKGIDWTSANNVYWMHNVQRFESLKVILQGNAEFEATDVVLQGNQVFEVPNGHRMHVTSGDSGFVVKLEPIEEEMMDSGSWFWKYKLNGTHIQLELVEL
ncbi:UTP--glucose-1-phosphate uridylyltransferase protein [Dioscorea alata]|uniref:UTP--glucose-1-phosphate uridylyltransferase protein n=1 Tax=Dioscorea alata TaxID=55571 RepID=A0ACB7U932_DIOAL|nr:UTP--glucose-1-phosphate uridylyltransferase protein [Dioscorea alata]